MTTQTDTPSSSILPAAQLAVAARMARAHGHEWAGRIRYAADCPFRRDGDPTDGDRDLITEPEHEYLVIGRDAISPAAIAACGERDFERMVAFEGRDRALLWAGPGGIAWPVLVEDAVDWNDATLPPFIEHTTGSGRLRWTVTADGTAYFAVCRPDPTGEYPAGFVVCRGSVTAGGAVEAEDYAGDTEGPTLHTRHVAALRFAILAALGLVHHQSDDLPLGEEPAAVREALAPLYAAALPDGEPVDRRCPHCDAANYVLETVAVPHCHVCGRAFVEPLTAAHW